MKKDKVCDLDKDMLRGRYEELRSEVLDTGYIRSQGYALFLRQGMRRWLEAWSECGVPAHRTEERRDVSLPQSFSSDLRREAAILLANMALHSRKEVRPI